MKIALIGIGKIARDQHVPAIANSADWNLAATVSRTGTVDDVPAYTNIDTMLAENPEIRAVSLCLPPVPRFAYAKAALLAGRHVMLEKPPGATLAEVHALAALAQTQGSTLFTTWHSRMAQGVAQAKALLAGKSVIKGHITWKEDVRRWHPGQDWVFAAGGMGVFDPGINALSILTEILPAPVHLQDARLDVPENCQTPIAAQLTFSNGITADFDWRQEGPQNWDMWIETAENRVELSEGGSKINVDGRDITGEAAGASLLGEYPALYARMADLVRTGASDIDLSPMVHVADAMTLGKRVSLPAFHL
ncbi:Gfo/Idh/MocA family oxidoreductase [Octadecabacter sp. SW4]|uniref:Gfo/Idh/MocA family protein n=1 Tax=Octadecabacter sp. SW4 TaxID=2602067 RepID=UPI0011C20BEC|nr:Gfo/Idh/MocA family oxidoreductase [Octadecabacter sp. SW4]QEE37136.1 Gfo/Idh/MocA family oxidoreductase [Octadecabacter sp. SW4]